MENPVPFIFLEYIWFLYFLIKGKTGFWFDLWCSVSILVYILFSISISSPFRRLAVTLGDSSSTFFLLPLSSPWHHLSLLLTLTYNSLSCNFPQKYPNLIGFLINFLWEYYMQKSVHIFSQKTHVVRTLIIKESCEQPRNPPFANTQSVSLLFPQINHCSDIP